MGILIHYELISPLSCFIPFHDYRQTGLAHVCLITGNLTVTKGRIETNIPKKRTGSSGHSKAINKFYEAVYQAVVEMHPNKKIVAVFQPHLFSRTKDFVDGFAKSLSKFDDVLLLDIYPAREKPIQGVTSAWLLEKIENPNKKLVAKENIIGEINNCKPEVLVTMGAGDIGLEVVKIKNELANAG